MNDVAPGDLTTLSVRELGVLLNGIDRAMEEIVPQQVEAEKALARAETVLVFDPSNKDAKVNRIREKGHLKALGHETKALRLRQSRIQSILKTTSI